MNGPGRTGSTSHANSSQGPICMLSWDEDFMCPEAMVCETQAGWNLCNW